LNVYAGTRERRRYSFNPFVTSALEGEGAGRTVTDTNVMLVVTGEHILAAKNSEYFMFPTSV
jgi:hypothetical protein